MILTCYHYRCFIMHYDATQKEKKDSPTRQLADLKSVGISGAPLDFVDFNSFNRIFTIVYIVRNIYYNFTQNTSSSIFFIFCSFRALSELTLVVH